MRATGERGFTLLELLIAMTLLGLLMLGLFGGLRLGVRVWEAGDAQSADRMRIEAVQRFIRGYLGRARPLVVADRRGDDVIAFIGRDAGLEFTTALPAHLSAGGFDHVALSLADLDGRKGLILRHGPLQRRDDGRAELIPLDEAETAVLLDDVAAVEISYSACAIATRTANGPIVGTTRRGCRSWSGSGSVFRSPTAGVGPI